MNPDQPAQERLFFALWPSDVERESLLDCIHRLSKEQWQGRRVSPANLHITLHFLGNIPAGRVDCFIQQAKTVALPRFEIRLDKVGYFKKPKVLWLGCEHVADELQQLHYDLGRKIQHCGYQPESRAYTPHVTIWRKLPAAKYDLQIEPMSWHIDSFVLVKSVTHNSGVEYQICHRF